MNVRRFAPRIIAVVVFLSGFFNILYAFFPQRNWLIMLERFVPLEVQNASRTFTSIAGFFLLAVASGLWNRKWRAWFLSVGALAASLIFHLTRGITVVDVLTLLVPLALLLIFRLQFSVRSARSQFVQRFTIALLLLCALFLYAVIGFFFLQGQFYQHVDWKTVAQDYEYTVFGVGRDSLVPKTRRAVWFEDSISTVGIFVVVSIFAGLFAPSLFSSSISEEDLQRVRRYVLRHGDQSVSYFALTDDKEYFFSKNRLSAVAYAIEDGTAVVLGDVLGPLEERAQAMQEFLRETRQHGLKALWYFLSKEHVERAKIVGLKALQIGEEALVSLAAFSLEGSSMKNLRNAVSHIEKLHYTFLWFSMDNIPWYIQAAADQLHEEWLHARRTVPLTFSLDFYPIPEEKNGIVGVALNEHGEVHALCSFLPYHKQLGYALDLMMKHHDAPNGTLETLIVKSFERLQEKKVEEVSLGLAVLNHLDHEKDETTKEGFPEKAVQLFKERFKRFYDYQSLAQFKNKFQPRWEPRYMAYTHEAELLQEIRALIHVHTETSLIALLRK